MEQDQNKRTRPQRRALAEWAPHERDPVALTEHVRAALRRVITHRYAGDGGALAAYLLDPMIEDAIRESVQVGLGITLISRTLGRGPVGPYQLQAAIAAVHDEARTWAETDWPQILALYEVLEQVAPGPVVTLNRSVAVAMVDGPRAGLAVLGTIEDDARVAHSHRLESVRGHLLELAGDIEAARDAYRRAARMTASVPEQRYLALRAARLGA